MFMLTLMQKGTISRQMTATQMIRIFMEELSNTDLRTEVLKIHSPSADDDAPFEITEQAREQYEVVFMGPSGWLNIASRVSADAVSALRHDAKISFDALTTGGLGSFDALFMTEVPFWNSFDQYITVPIPEQRSRCKHSRCPFSCSLSLLLQPLLYSYTPTPLATYLLL